MKNRFCIRFSHLDEALSFSLYFYPKISPLFQIKLSVEPFDWFWNRLYWKTTKKFLVIAYRVQCPRITLSLQGSTCITWNLFNDQHLQTGGIKIVVPSIFVFSSNQEKLWVHHAQLVISKIMSLAIELKTLKKSLDRATTKNSTIWSIVVIFSIFQKHQRGKGKKIILTTKLISIKVWSKIHLIMVL